MKHHIIIALGLALWVFLFLVLTEPLDTDVFSTTEKLTYLPLYGIAAALTYLLIVPLQYALLKWYQQRWTLLAEILFLTSIIFIGFLLARFVYLYFIVPDEPNP
ncbi:MAG TPA: LytTR family transcriptional regulator, partial [Flavobacteriaceae bacterium]|nr:LytTR family transcriptional regulator [Flavobacteriaceae bacterium]